MVTKTERNSWYSLRQNKLRADFQMTTKNQWRHSIQQSRENQSHIQMNLGEVYPKPLNKQKKNEIDLLY